MVNLIKRGRKWLTNIICQWIAQRDIPTVKNKKNIFMDPQLLDQPMT